jgi:para-aminobenzoate synthetase/4-amino-4-deoxychorismate lyase
MQGQQFGSPVGLYRRLRELQPVAFGALVALGDRWVLSCSPELFVRNSGGHLTTRPMKGTAPRDFSTEDDTRLIHWLGRDPKNRAENVMIVDLLRNDLGRISEIGSVQVPQLFSVETYRTVHQMTSTVQSRIRPDVDMPGVLRALFPCGSITGTPKVNTMDWIAELESGPRGLYCGAIGWMDAPKTPALCGDFCLSVAIRTITLGEPQDALRPATLGVGGGIVLDSVQGNEFEETLVKARFLTRIDPGLTLFETLLLHHGRLRNLNLHLARLESSADALGFRFDATQVKTELARYASALDPSVRHRVRLDLEHSGQVRLSHAVLDALPRGSVRLVLSKLPIPEQDRALLHHKTSLRSTYDQAIRDAAKLGAFDAVFVNARGEVTEGARSNVLVKLAGQWWTPPLSCGVLPGVMRTRLLRMRPEIGQKTLRLEDLVHAQELAVCSSLRGVLRAELVLPAP